MFTFKTTTTTKPKTQTSTPFPHLDLEAQLQVALSNVRAAREHLADVARDRMDIEVYESSFLPGKSAVIRGLELDYEEAADKYTDAQDVVTEITKAMEKAEAEA